ncbi:substrate-binding periplasmic protein [Goodfellowiella coeruleoviolacea]|uniref:Polar amino acid transport system substrate-binding protein n=1 Tax=Goodfellowiella coeruleoviolacea TaxID=334858 RepID=A0AAE3KL54_9PSEU|nr:transporter substrate-binding domain-containing protein [Goodfellowiella coeruleoviolacea]MCP2166163.1 polar amino acid transport system substrate-binding protein [Goodfellowiella coeruleoviolacea]
MRKTLLRALALATSGLAACVMAACGTGTPAANSSGTQQEGVLRIGTLTDAPPAIYQQDGEFTGYDNELLKVIAAKEGLKTEFVGTEFSSLLSQVNNGQFDVGSSSISSTAARKKTVDFSNGYSTGFTSIITRTGAGSAEVGGYAGKRLGVVQASIQDDFASSKVPGAEVVRFPGYNEGFAALRNGGVDGWVVPKEIGQKYIDQNPDIALEHAFTVETKDTPSAYAVRKGNTALLDKLNHGLAEAIKDGTLEQLYTRFYPNQPLPDELKKGGAGLPVTNS